MHNAFRLDIFTLSPKTAAAFRNGLAFTLSFWIPLALNWSSQAATAAVTVLVISTTTQNTQDAFAKGLWRVVGTLLGAGLGMGLIALFPQQPAAYFAAMGLTVFFLLFFARAWQGDNTLFVLAAVMLLMSFKEGRVDNVTLYVAERLFMTLFGLIVYTAVWALLWPPKNRLLAKPAPKEIAWHCIEHWLGALAGLLVYGAGLLFWYWFNPPMGFMTVALAVAMSVALLFSPVTPAMMLIAFSLGLALAALGYIWVLPNLTDGWQLALFLFIYAFLAYRFLPPPMTLIVLIGTTTFHLQSVAFFDMGLFLNILFVLYAFLFLLLLFYHLPFSSRPEKRFLRLFNALKSKRAADNPALRRSLTATLRDVTATLPYKRLGIKREAMQNWLASLERGGAITPPPGFARLRKGRF